MYHYTESGLDNIWLINGYCIIVDEDYGECVSISDVTGLNRAIGHDLVFNKPSLTGAEFRFLRKELDLSQKALADLMGKDEQSIARWEKSAKAPKYADRMLRALVLDFYGEKISLLALIDRIRDIDEQEWMAQKFEDDASGWKKSA